MPWTNLDIEAFSDDACTVSTGPALSIVLDSCEVAGPKFEKYAKVGDTIVYEEFNAESVDGICNAPSGANGKTWTINDGACLPVNPDDGSWYKVTDTTVYPAEYNPDPAL